MSVEVGCRTTYKQGNVTFFTQLSYVMSMTSRQKFIHGKYIVHRSAGRVAARRHSFNLPPIKP